MATNQEFNIMKYKNISSKFTLQTHRMMEYGGQYK